MNDMYLADELSRQTLSNQTLLKSNIFKQELSTKRLSNDLIFNFIDGTKATNDDTKLQVKTNMNESIDEEHEYENDFEAGDGSEPNCFERYTVVDSIRHRKKIKKFFDQLLFERTNNTTSTKPDEAAEEAESSSCFLCVCCRLRLQSSKAFLQHCSASNEHGLFRPNKEQETFFNNNLAAKVESKIIVLLIESQMKQLFLEKYSQDLLVANEETALCLDELNKEKRAHKRHDDEADDDYDEFVKENNADECDISGEPPVLNDDHQLHNQYSLLFIDYSIIKFSRIISKLRNVYCDSESSFDSPSSSEIESLSSSMNELNKRKPNERELNSAASPLSTVSSSSLDSLLDMDLIQQSNGRNYQFVKSENESNTPLKTHHDNLKRSQSLVNSIRLSAQVKKPVEASAPTNPIVAATATNNIMHSRNACKKLKCPKCNWHYKYRETLDIHMREKHSTDLAGSMSQKCIYCMENSQHPRLGRGEQYKCGYKPYRCDICDYSTTTKGNLSIHMQSDKHVNNLKEIKASGLTATSKSLPCEEQSPQDHTDNEVEQASANLTDGETGDNLNDKNLGLVKQSLNPVNATNKLNGTQTQKFNAKSKDANSLGKIFFY